MWPQGFLQGSCFRDLEVFSLLQGGEESISSLYVGAPEAVVDFRVSMGAHGYS